MQTAIPYEERIKWFNEARFGMFIHWGIYSIPARGENVMFGECIPRDEYAVYADQFNPDKFDPDAWANLAVEAGAKYMVFTARHHDGFSMFDSKASDFTSVKTAAKRDFVAEYVTACRKAGLKVGLYYSWLDARFPGYFDRVKYPESFKALVKQAHVQIEELMTNYGKIDILWYDGHWFDDVFPYPDGGKAAELWGAKEVNAMVRRLQPHILINNRSGLKEDLTTPEQEAALASVVNGNPSEIYKNMQAWESCMTIGDFRGWGYIRNNPNLKTVPQLIQYLVMAASKGGNYLLNVGPKPDGTIQEEFVYRFKEIGKWMKANGESIYGSEPCVIDPGMIGITTAKGNTAYLHAFRFGIPYVT